MSDTPVRLPDYVTDELFRSAMRVTEEVVRLTAGLQHGGLDCVLVPETIIERLEKIVVVANKHAPDDWRP